MGFTTWDAVPSGEGARDEARLPGPEDLGGVREGRLEELFDLTAGLEALRDIFLAERAEKIDGSGEPIRGVQVAVFCDAVAFEELRDDTATVGFEALRDIAFARDEATNGSDAMGTDEAAP